MRGEKILSALTGLVGATSGHDKSDNTDRILCESLIAIGQIEMLKSEAMIIEVEEIEAAQIEAIHKEKFTIAPGCAVCKSPCGNTSDQDLSYVDQADEERKEAIDELLNALIKAAANYLTKETGELSQNVYTGVAYIGYDLETASYHRITKKLS